MCPSLAYLLGNQIVHKSGTKYHLSTTKEAATVRRKDSTGEKGTVTACDNFDNQSQNSITM